MATIDQTADEYWRHFDDDEPIESVEAALAWATRVTGWLQSRGVHLPMVYRGQKSTEWGLNSSLYRILPKPVSEKAMVAAERATIGRLRDWQLLLHASGLLRPFQALATLQHLGGKTRLIDVTHSLLVALWFAVDEDPDTDGVDGRLFALTYSKELSHLHPGWEEHFEPYWWQWENRDAWPDDLVVWTPPPVERRMARQHGAFLVGRVPRVDHNLRQLPNQDSVSIPSWQSIVSVSKRAYRLSPQAGRTPKTTQLLLTARVSANAKSSVREHLDRYHAISARTLHPDFAGFVKFEATPWS